MAAIGPPLPTCAVQKRSSSVAVDVEWPRGLSALPGRVADWRAGLGRSLFSPFLALPSLQLHHRALVTVGSEEAPSERLASVRRSNWTCSFPASSFHEWTCAIRREGMSAIRLTSLNSLRSRFVGYSFQPVFRHRRVRCDHSLRIIQPSS
jgi:hypothetical protein